MIGRRKTWYLKTLTWTSVVVGTFWGWGLWLLVVNMYCVLCEDIEINFYNLISISTTYYNTTITT